MSRRLRMLATLLAVMTTLAACGGGGGGGDDAPDTIAPTVTYVTPSNNAASVGTNSRLTVTFSEPMSEASLAAAIALADAQTDAPVALGSVAYDAANRIATVTPQQPLAPSRAYRASVSAAARDSNGNAMAGGYAWTFGTAAGADTTPPTVNSHSPADGATGVVLNTRMALSFSEPMDVASVEAAFVLMRGPAEVRGRLAYVGQAAVFTPDEPLAPQTTYVATLRRAATDLAGNALAADYAWAFTTGATPDTTPPSVVAVTPAPNSSGVPRNALLSVTFSEPIYPFVYGTIDGAVVEVAIDYSTNTVSVLPTQPLRENGGYAASIQVMDLARNAMAPYQWTFVTAR
jgi:Bacterial Ig-like domain